MRDYILKNGLTLGIVQVVMVLISYMMGIDFMISSWWGVVQFVVVVSLILYLAIQFRNAQGGFATFKECFSVLFGMYAAGGFILTFFNILLYNFIDPELSVMMQEAIIEKAYEMMAGFGAADASVEEAMEKMAEQNRFSAASLAQGYLFSMPVYIVLSLVIAAFIKKNKPEFDA